MPKTSEIYNSSAQNKKHNVVHEKSSMLKFVPTFYQ